MRLALGAVALAAAFASAPAVGAGGSAEQPVPVYGITATDATTGPNGIPPPNPLGPSEAVDSYGADVYERPIAARGQTVEVLPAVDIASARAGIGRSHLHYRIDLAGLDASTGRLAHSYAFELDYDDDAAGDLLVRVDDPGGSSSSSFGTGGVSVFWNQNSNATGPNPGFPDGPGATPDGYEVVVFEQGTARLAGAAANAEVVAARLAPDRRASLELAVDAAFLQSLNDDLPVSKVSVRAGASRTSLHPGSYYLHDKLGRAEAGSPYPFLQSPGAPAVCPATDAALPAEQRSALDSGTGAETGLPNPCHHRMELSAYDNTAFVTMAPPTRTTAGDPGGEQAAAGAADDGPAGPAEQQRSEGGRRLAAVALGVATLLLAVLSKWIRPRSVSPPGTPSSSPSGRAGRRRDPLRSR